MLCFYSLFESGKYLYGHQHGGNVIFFQQWKYKTSFLKAVLSALRKGGRVDVNSPTTDPNLFACFVDFEEGLLH
jgi:hypothetical protein